MIIRLQICAYYQRDSCWLRESRNHIESLRNCIYTKKNCDLDFICRIYLKYFSSSRFCVTTSISTIRGIRVKGGDVLKSKPQNLVCNHIYSTPLDSVRCCFVIYVRTLAVAYSAIFCWAGATLLFVAKRR